VYVSTRLEIIDAQVHLNQLVPDWATAPVDSVISAAIQAMDAVGVDGVLISEAHGFTPTFEPPGEALPNGAVRTSYPFSERAVELHPDRFIYHVRIDYRDPEPDRVAEELKSRPGVRAMRIVPIPQTGEAAALERGEFDAVFAAAERHGLPVFAWVPGRAELLAPYAEKFPNLQFIIDHTGVGVAPLRVGELPVTVASSLTESRDERLAQLERVCDMAQYRNVALKWSSAPTLLSEEDFPYRDLMPLLRQAIDAFGAERVMWASDYTVARARNRNSWAECLYYVSESDQLSRTEKEWILGGAVRQVLGWPRG
jgi:L-fuconolactonase